MDTIRVSELNAYIKALLDGDGLLGDVTVSGELSNYKIYPSGHHYFTIKDESGILKCVMFKREASNLGFRPQDGQRVLARGRVTVYPRDGAYQLYCSQIIPDGEGALTMAFEALRAKLEAEGLFDPAHKKQLPDFPERIVLITSPAGAAVRDMIKILAARWPMAKVIIAPVRVQGEEAPGEITSVMRYVNKHKLGDVIITGRGGGSLEDLWAFNDERVARAIFASVIPVVSAVGHEPDVTIADFVADVRASTPSNAAELVVPDRMEMLRYIRGVEQRLPSALENSVRLRKAKLAQYKIHFAQPRFLDTPRQLLDSRRERIASAWKASYQPQSYLLRELAGRLDALSPLKVLSRGYAVAELDGNAVRDASMLKNGDSLIIRLEKGKTRAVVDSAVI